MTILFVADIHLSIYRPKITNKFLKFLRNKAENAQALYILGDLFEIWIGDDNWNILYINIANAIKKISQKNIPCYFIHGNHDCLLGSQYAKLCGMILLPKIKIIKLLSGKKIVLLHGDILCMNDSLYRIYRKLFFLDKTKKILLSLPLSIRQYIYIIIRFLSKNYQKYKINKKCDHMIDIHKVLKIFTKYQVDIMIHGHLHQPAIHIIYNQSQKKFTRIVLGFWNQNGSVVEINEEGHYISLVEFSL